MKAAAAAVSSQSHNANLSDNYSPYPQKPTKTSPKFCGYLLSSSKKRKKTIILAMALDKGLQPKPTVTRTIEERSEIVVGETEGMEDSRTTQMKKHQMQRLCDQIEKLVYFGRFDEAIELFEFVKRAQDFVIGITTVDALVNACIAMKSIKGAKRVYQYVSSDCGISSNDQYLMNRMLLMHVKCEMMIDARLMFDEMSERNLISYNIMIGGIVDCGEYEEALRLFLRMKDEVSDDVSLRTFVCVVRACAGLGDVSIGRQVHCCLVKLKFDVEVFMGCGLIDMYSKCGCIEDAFRAFSEMPEKNVVAWNCIIAGYGLHGYSDKAMELYHEMERIGMKADHFTYSTIVRICVRLASHDHARQAHARLVRHGFGYDVVANTALIDFYSKWGRLEDARAIFDKMANKNIVSWNALIAGYGNHGHGEKALNLFEEMIRRGFTPNHVTFLAVLSACSYSGLWEEGWHYFVSMRRDFKIKPRAMHYACMIELYGREGLLDKALALIKEAPLRPSKNMWAALLTACRIHRNFQLGKFAAEKLLDLEPEKQSNYIVLLNVYNSSGKPCDAARVRELLMKKGIRVLEPCSWIEIKKSTYWFSFGDKRHVRSKEIYQKLDEVTEQIRNMGYAPKKNTVLPDFPEIGEQNHGVCHSEKVAISFGLISTSRSVSLRVVQTHRLCDDCHDAIKLIAQASEREIIVRDASRFHRFKHGKCSCGDYW